MPYSWTVERTTGATCIWDDGMTAQGCMAIRNLTSSPMVLIALAQVQILSAAPMVLLRIMVALLGIVLVLIRILSASPMVLLLISRSS